MERNIIQLSNLIIFLHATSKDLRLYDREKNPEQHRTYRSVITSEIKSAIKNGVITEDEGLDLAIEFICN